jgi:hypothetical protein
MGLVVDFKNPTAYPTLSTPITFAFYSPKKIKMINAEAVLVVKFNSSHSPSRLSDVCVDDLETFRNVPGLLQKYYVAEELGSAISGIYIFESRSARAAFWTSELARQIPARYGVIPETLHVEEYEMILVLNDVTYA